jgi:hypothetical protein
MCHLSVQSDNSSVDYYVYFDDDILNGPHDDGIDGNSMGGDKEAFQYFTEGVLLTGVSIFGIVGTLMSIGVLVKRDVR